MSASERSYFPLVDFSPAAFDFGLVVRVGIFVYRRLSERGEKKVSLFVKLSPGFLFEEGMKERQPDVRWKGAIVIWG